MSSSSEFSGEVTSVAFLDQVSVAKPFHHVNLLATAVRQTARAVFPLPCACDLLLP